MPESAETKVKILKRMLIREIQTRDSVPNMDKTLTQNEFFIKSQLQGLEDNMKVANDLDRQVVAICEDDDEVFVAYTKDRIFEQLRDLYYTQVMTYNEMLKSINPVLDASSFDAQSTQVLSNNSSLLNLSAIKLPTLTIEPFNGNYEKWADFKDIFESSINNNPTLCNSTNLQYLQTFLKGEALKVVKRGSERLKPENYNSIWASLINRYEHKRSLVNSYFQIFFNQKIMVKETSKDLKSLHDTTYDVLRSLQNMGLRTEAWGDILVFLVTSKLPLHTRELWEEKIGINDSLPEFETFMKFIETRFRTLEGIEATKSQLVEINKRHSPVRKITLHTELKNQKYKKDHVKNTQKCKCCQKDAHYLYKCDEFRQLSTDEKVKFVNQQKYCYNCLGFHKVSECSSNSRCQKCKYKHHTLLHLESRQAGSSRNLQQDPPDETEGVPSTSDGRFSETYSTVSSRFNPAVIFPTAVINVINSNGFACKFRALIDACSDESYITEKACRKLQLPKQSQVVETSGLGGVSTMTSEYVTKFTIQSLVERNFLANIKAYVLSKISTARPSQIIERILLSEDITLADPKYNIPSDIDILLGGGIDALISMSGCIKNPENNIVLKQTTLGWIISGGQSPSQCFTISRREPQLSLGSLDNIIRKFWEIEEPPAKKYLTKDEKLAEKIYEATTKRLSTGKYMVSLPFKNETHEFLNMRKIALTRYFQIESKLSKNEKLYNEYSACLNDYITMNHMSEVNPELFTDSYYIPHHCVIKESSSTTKLRVVFDASANDSNMNSLNANILTGPRLQDDLLDLLIRFRTFKYAFTADIQQMYRQIWINPFDRRFQLILWRPNKNSHIKTFALNTVTFGTSSAPYVAVKTLTQLAIDEKINFPLGANCLENAFYVDDFIFGADTIVEALQIQYETKAILQTAGFNLRKWSANNKILLEKIPIEERETNTLLSFEDIEQSVKTLGIHWSPSDDLFHFQINVVEHVTHTKRSILSDIARIFDPLGWLSPTTIIAKLMIQKLWLKQQDWDEPISQEVQSEWFEFRQTLPKLEEIKLPRWLGTSRSQHIELHGFSDASEKAYAAVIYVRTVDKESASHLLFAKTKVAPLKKVSLPRLELCAAQLVAKLMAHAKKILKLETICSYYWSDSTITLAWIKDSPHKRTTYVANRVSEIQSLSSPQSWNHVSSQENPADLGTRGIMPTELKLNKLWWHGPPFLKSFNEMSPNFCNSESVQLPEEENKREKSIIVRSTQILESFLTYRKIPIVETLTNVINFNSNCADILNKFSTLSKLCRVVAYCKRIQFSNRKRKPYLYIDPEEYEEALLTILRMVQSESFFQEIEDLKKNRPLEKSSSILTLSPIYSEKDRLIRMNSRLAEADHLSFDQKFPIILPRTHFVSRLIVRHAHNTTLHGTSQQTLMLVNQRYHIIRCSTLVKNVIHHCIRCYRFRCGIQSQQMAPLPYNRISPMRAFLVCGVDLAGPFNLKKWKGRCNQFTKAYFAIFVCFSIKAVHLEVVVDLSSSEFIAAYRRFISRRGTPTDVYSDCGTNFVGAEGIITRKKREHLKKWNEEMAKEMSEFHTKWHFNSPSSPHMGGLWEAGVKSAKYHLKRVVGNASLSYDEFETILFQIEACMNSRPLTSVKDSADFLVLTPAHFLIQGPLTALPEQNLDNTKMSTIDRYNYLQRLTQQFWKFWSYDYLNTLRDRKKWRNSTKNVEINDVVLIKDSNLPPTVWSMGLVINVHPGKDGLVRVVTVKTKNSTIERPIVKLSPLPINESN